MKTTILASLQAWLTRRAAPLAAAVLLGAALGIALENRPAGVPSLPFGLRLDSPAAQRDAALADEAAWRAAFGKEQLAFGLMSDAVDLQSSAARRASAQSLAWRSASQAAANRASAANAWRETLASRILDDKAPIGADALAQCKAAETVLRVGGQ